MMRFFKKNSKFRSSSPQHDTASGMDISVAEEQQIIKETAARVAPEMDLDTLIDLRKSVIDTGLFDEQFYKKKYPDLQDFKGCLALHYIFFGEKECRQPNQIFNVTFYQKQVRKKRLSQKLALLDYAQSGWKKGLDPARNFSVSAYLAENKDVKKSGAEPLAHYLAFGQRENRFIRISKKADKPFRDLMEGIKKLEASKLFLPDWYVAAHSDLYGTETNAYEHYWLCGRFEMRRPNPWFDPVWYAKEYRKSVGEEDPLTHWITTGSQKGFSPSSEFASDVYFAENSDVTLGVNDPLRHYIEFGLKEGRGFPHPNKRSQPLSDDEQDIDISNALPLSKDLRGLIDYDRLPLDPQSSEFDPKALILHWIMPDFQKGAGGHMTIFRMVSHLERRGHKQTIWIQSPVFHKTTGDAHDTIIKYFQHFTGEVRFVDETLKQIEGDAIIATDCFSVWPCLSVSNVKQRFYFVQDHEPSFHAVGSRSIAADMTYQQGLDCICASPWLENMMTSRYGCWAKSFWLAADRSLYFPLSNKALKAKTGLTTKTGYKPRIAVYARTHTARRLVEMAFLGLEVLAKRGISFHVDFFGMAVDFDVAPFSFTDHGIATQEQLAEIFRKADIGLVFSATNYSLVPQEMMACGLPIIEYDGANTRAIFPNECVTFTKADPLLIADAVSDLLKDPLKRQQQSDAALKWVSQFSWDKSANAVEQAFIGRLTELATPVNDADTNSISGADKRLSRSAIDTDPKASVVIPTLNPGPVFQKVLESVVQQQAPFKYEILVIDSGSTDGTIELVGKYDAIKLHQIDKSEFNHGDTRNLGVELTKGEYVAFLTHDALPANKH